MTHPTDPTRTPLAEGKWGAGPFYLSDAVHYIELIAPLAKAYAAAHPVGSNAEYVAEAEDYAYEARFFLENAPTPQAQHSDGWVLVPRERLQHAVDLIAKLHEQRARHVLERLLEAAPPPLPPQDGQGET